VLRESSGRLKLSEFDLWKLEFHWNLALGIWSLPLGLPAADDHQNDSADQTNPAQYRGKRNGLLLFSSRLNWADIQHLFALGVRDPAIRQRDDADNDENDADNSGWLHRFDVTLTL
jgi:hypothetical protein